MGGTEFEGTVTALIPLDDVAMRNFAVKTQIFLIVSRHALISNSRRMAPFVVQDSKVCALPVSVIACEGNETSTRPTVEECLRYVREADLLVGIIAWRYGWEPDGRKFITEMEYDAAKERRMFLIDPKLPVNPDEDFDPGEERWDKQKKLEVFKKRISGDQMPALFTETKLHGKVIQALNDWRNAREPKKQTRRARTKKAKPLVVADKAFEEEIRNYCQKADSLHANLPVAGFVTQLKVPIDIEDIYVPLHAVLDLRGVGGECFADSAQAEAELRKCNAGLEIALPEAFRQCSERKRRGIVILGDPGAGKTTLLKRLMLSCLRKGAASIELPEGMLQVFLPLRDLQDLQHGLEAFIQKELDSPHLNTPEGFGARLLKRGNLLFLLDGLGEVPDRPERKRVAEWIENGLKSHPTCWFVVTSRFAGYTPDVHLGADFLEMHIRPLSEEQVAGFVHNWYRIVEAGLAKHPFDQLRQWLRERARKAVQDVLYAVRGEYELVRIPAGAFMMGSPPSEKDRLDNEGPQHEVRMTDFYMGRYPVTNEEYGRFLKDNPKVKPPEYWADRQFNQPRQPVVGVSWEDAQRYAIWAGLKLPSEAEWEYACRAGTSTRFYSGETEKDLDEAGWYGKNSGDKLHPVGEKKPNARGLYDMHGNVWEWVEDDWHDSYKGAPDDGSAWIDKPRGSARVIRGGGWAIVAQDCRSATRSFFRPGRRDNRVGFRLSRSVALGP